MAVEKSVSIGLFTICCLSSAAFGLQPSSDGAGTHSDDKFVVILLDGFRHDYAEPTHSDQPLPTFDRFKSNGVKADYVSPIFPSVSFPSWTTIVTGLYPESHGILDNTMLDPLTGHEFDMDTPESTSDPNWYSDHIPLWASATAEGRRVAMYYWSVCDIPFQIGNRSVLPEKCLSYDPVLTVTLPAFVESLELALHDLEFGMDTIFLYTAAVDETGHDFGPDAKRLKKMIQNVDESIGTFLDGLEKLNIMQKTNIILVSDHGMKDRLGLKIENIYQYTSRSNVAKTIGSGGRMHVFTPDGVDDSAVTEELNQVPEVDAYLRGDIPDYLHLGNHRLNADITLVTRDEKTHVTDGPHLPYITSGGKHGWTDIAEDECVSCYDTEGNSPDMRAIFYAMGPRFKKAYRQPWIKLVDEYQVFVEVLGIQGMPHNGTWERVRGMFA